MHYTQRAIRLWVTLDVNAQKNERTAERMTQIFRGAHARPSRVEGRCESKKKKRSRTDMNALRHYRLESNSAVIISAR